MRGRRAWIWPVIAAAIIHLAVLVPQAGDGSFILDRIFRPDAEGILAGEKPYAERDLEYPPLAIPVLAAPAAVSGDTLGYRTAFGYEMILFDLAILMLLAFALRRSPRAAIAALAVYTVGVLVLGRLVLARFDLVPAALALAAVVARESGRSALWGIAASAGTAVKAFPLLLVPALLRGERRPLSVLAGALVPLGLAIAAVAMFGDEFSSAIAYHTERDLQIEALAATPLLVAHELGMDARTTFGAGSFNLDAPGAEIARALTVGLMVSAYLLATIAVWQRRIPPMAAATLIVTVLVVLAPVLSPQFLLWILPLSAAAFGLGLENALLLSAVALTRVMQDSYEQVVDLGQGFIWPSVARNLLLVAYLALISARLYRRRRTTTPSSAKAVA